MSRNPLREKIGKWELWPFNVIYAPIGPLWLWYAAKAGSFWWFTPANPTLTFAGFDGEGKKEMYDQLSEDLYPATVYVDPSQTFADIKQAVTSKELRYPVCVKPQVGLKGLLFRKVENEEKLEFYHQHVPVPYLVQELVETTMEVSVFYYRYPNK